MIINLHTNIKTYPVFCRVLFFIVCMVFSTFASAQKLKNRKDSLQYDVQTFKFENLLVQANRLKNAGDFEQATSLYLDCIQIFPNSGTVYYELAQIYASQKNFSEALKSVEKAIKIAPQDDYYKFKIKLYERLSMYKNQEDLYKYLISKNPKDLKLRYDLVSVYYKQKDFENAVNELDKIQKEYGVNEYILREKSKIYAAQGNYDKTIEELKTLCEKFPFHEENWYLLANVYTILEQYDDALAIYRNLIANSKNYGKALTKRAEIFAKQNQLDSLALELHVIYASPYVTLVEKQSTFSRVFELLPYNSEFHKTKYALMHGLLQICPQDFNLTKQLAYYYYSVDSLRDNSLPYLYSVVENKQQDDKIYFMILSVELNYENWDSLFSIASKAYEQYPFKQEFLIQKAYALYGMKKYDEAILTYNQVRLFNKSVRAQTKSLMALVYFAQGNTNKSFQLISEAKKEDYTNYTFKQTYAYLQSQLNGDENQINTILAECFRENNYDIFNSKIHAILFYNKQEYSKAATVQNKILSRYQTKSNYEFMGDIFYKQGKAQQAEQMWRKAIDLGTDININRKAVLLQGK